MIGIDGHTELFQRHGTQQRTTSRRPGEEDRRALGVGEPDTHFSKWPHVALAVGELYRSLLRRRERQPGDDVRGEHRVHRPGVDEEIEGSRSLTVVRMNQRRVNGEGAHVSEGYHAAPTAGNVHQ